MKQSALAQPLPGVNSTSEDSSSFTQRDTLPSGSIEITRALEIPEESHQSRLHYKGGTFILPEQALYEHGTKLIIPLNDVVFFQPDVNLSVVLQKIADDTLCTPARVTPVHFMKNEGGSQLAFLLMDGNNSLVSKIILQGNSLQHLEVTIQDVHSLIELCGSEEIDALMKSLNERCGRLPELKNDLR